MLERIELERDAVSKKSLFTPEEIAYLQTQRLGRIATVDSHGQPHVVPVAFRYNPEAGTIEVGGHSGFAKRKKWRDVQRNPKVAIVFDDVVAGPPRIARGLEVRGEAELLLQGGAGILPGFDPEMFRIKPSHVASWGINRTNSD